MIDLLGKILCVLRNLALGVAWALCEFANVIIVGLGAFIAFAIGLLPELPALPAAAPPKAVSWLAWGFPVSTVLAAAAALCTMYGVFLLARIALKWAKAV